MGAFQRPREPEARGAATMGRLARTAWEEWFSLEICFHRTVEWCLRLKRYRHSHVISDFVPHIQLLRPFFGRHVLLPEIKHGGLHRLVEVEVASENHKRICHLLTDKVVTHRMRLLLV